MLQCFFKALGTRELEHLSLIALHVFEAWEPAKLYFPLVLNEFRLLLDLGHAGFHLVFHRFQGT